MPEQIAGLKQSGEQALPAYIRNIRLDLFSKSSRVILGQRTDPMSLLYALISVRRLLDRCSAPQLFLGRSNIPRLWKAAPVCICWTRARCCFEPGLHFGCVWGRRRRWFTVRAVLRDRCGLDQEYLRSNPVNTEEGTPMGVGVWYEMRVGGPLTIFQEC
jgi:hypothetical protein